MLEVERSLDNRGAPAPGTLQLQAAPKGLKNCAGISFHKSNPQISQISQIRALHFPSERLEHIETSKRFNLPHDTNELNLDPISATGSNMTAANSSARCD